ncbi:MAG: hypothetical protein ACYDEJ_04550 [Desulfitobacteriaceae bacterium]
MKNRTLIKIKSYALQTIVGKMKKEFGGIPKSQEEEFFDLLFVMEEVLLKAYLNNPNINSRRAKEAINICLLKAKGYINDVEYDFSGLVEQESIEIADRLSKTFIPFENEELQAVINNKYNLESGDDLREYFKDPINSLIRIFESVEYWEKGHGILGYFEFIKGHMLKLIDVDSDKVHFSVRLAKK